MDLDLLVTYAVAIAAVIGVVNGIRLLVVAKDYQGFALFSIAVILGMVFGYFKWFLVPSVEIGLLVGLASSGFYRLKQV